MNKISKLLALLVLTVVTLCSCLSTKGDVVGSQTDAIDYASTLKLDMSTDSLKQEVTVKAFIDGDTTHFYVPESIVDTGVLKARYLAVNTPESTGKIEEYGKKASEYTKSRLSEAVSIIIESDDNNWNIDSTGTRYLVWVWYKTADMADYKNLSIELLQNGLAIANSSGQNRYGDVALAAIAQAKEQKLNIYSGEQDPDFYYGDAVELTLKELRCNVSDYNGVKVAFNGVVTLNDSNSVYVEAYDPATDMYNGISVYYGYGLSGTGLDILSVGNEVRIVGTVQYYELGGTYQVSGLTYRQMRPDDPGNIQKISDGNSAAYVMTSADTFANGVASVYDEISDVSASYDYAYLALNTTVEMHDLEVKSVYTTVNEESSSYGAMTLTCESDGYTVLVRTAVMYDELGNLVTEDAFLGKIIDVKGVVDYYDGSYQIKTFALDNITIK